MAYARPSGPPDMSYVPVSAGNYAPASRPSVESTRRPERMNTINLDSEPRYAGYENPFDNREMEYLAASSSPYYLAASSSPYPPQPQAPLQYHYQRSRTNSETSRAPSPIMVASSSLEKGAFAASPPRRTFWSRFKSKRPEEEPEDLTDEEREMLSQGMVDWQAMRSWRFWFRRQWIWYYVALVLISVLVILMTVYHKQIVAWLKPAAEWMKELPAGWVIPIAVMFIISFPPLFGHEIVAILCGLVWGLWIGFGIVAAGTFLGEVGNFYAFKYCLRGRAEKMEKKSPQYALLAHVVREGGFKIVLLARLSAIPGHFSTAVFALCGVGIWTFMISAILSMPKQLIVVYLGVALEQTNASTSTKIAQDCMLGFSFLLTVAAAAYIYWQMNKARLPVFRAQKRALLEAEMREQGLSAIDSHKLETRAEDDADDVSALMFPSKSLQHKKSDLSYQIPYQATYRNAQGMSVYDVDDYHSANLQSPTTHGDLGQQTLFEQIPERRSPEAAFPTPQPAPLAPGVSRARTDASQLSTRPYQPPSPTAFPEPLPADGGLGRQDTLGSQAEVGYTSIRPLDTSGSTTGMRPMY